MRRVVLQMMTTVNGRLDDPGAWVANVPDDLWADIDRAYETFDTILVGHTTYNEMLEYWPGAEHDEANSETNRSVARKMNSYKKYVFSTAGERPLEWSNAELCHVQNDDDIVRTVKEIVERPGRDVHLSGGAQLAQTFVRLGLVDAFRLIIHPTHLPGVQRFNLLTEQQTLKLASATPYSDGIVGLYYES